MSCTLSPLDDLCSCGTRFSASKNSKLFDIESSEYLCCGKVGYSLSESVANNSGTLLLGAAAMDDARCERWWSSSILPAEQRAVAGAGPSSSQLAALEHHSKISAAFPLASSDGKTNTYSCTGKVSNISSLNTVPRYLSYKNPNPTGSNYVESVVCVPHDNTNTDSPYAFMNNTAFSQNQEFAIFKINGCTDPNSNTCVAPNGIDTAAVGGIEYVSSVYEGSRFPRHNDSEDDGGGIIPGMNSGSGGWGWLILLILIVLFFIFFFIFIYYIVRKITSTSSTETRVINRGPPPLSRPQQSYVEQSYNVQSMPQSRVLQPGYRGDPLNTFNGGTYYRSVSDSAANAVIS